MKQDTIANAAIVVLAICAVITTTAVVRRNFSRPEAPPSSVSVADWKNLATGGRRLGSADAPVVIVEFADFQCPFCASIASTLRDARKRFGEKVAVVYRHFPLTQIHPHALMAAIASECAAEQDRFETFHDLLFTLQDSIGKQQWSWFASRAGVRDQRAFADCLRSERAASKVSTDRAAGEALDIAATPTVFVNDRKVLARADRPLLDSLIQRALQQSTTK